MKAVIFQRVSTEDQSTDRQEEHLMRWATTNGHEVTQIFSETVSGSKRTKKRPVYNEMHDYVLDNDVKLIIISELNRLSRRQTEALQIIEYWEEKGVNIYISTFNLYILDDAGKMTMQAQLMTGMLSTFGESERRTLINRVNESVSTTTKKGIRIGRPPYGYIMKNKVLVIDEEQAKGVRMIFEKFAETNKYYTVVRHLIKNNIPTQRGGNWQTASIKQILSNKTYHGLYRNTVGEFEVPAIITKELFDRCQTGKKHSNEIFKGQKHLHPLQNKIRCSVCGGTAAGAHGRGDFSIYRCNNGHYKAGHLNVNFNMVNNLIIDLALTYGIDSDFLGSKIEELHLKQAELTEERTKAEKELEKAEKELKGYRKLFAIDEDYTQTDYERDSNQTKGAKQRASNAIDRINEQINDLHKAFEVYMNPQKVKESFHTSMQTFAEYCQHNIISVTVEAMQKGGEIYNTFVNEVKADKRSAVYRVAIKARLYEVAVYICSRGWWYVLESPTGTKLKLPKLLILSTPKDLEIRMNNFTNNLLFGGILKPFKWLRVPPATDIKQAKKKLIYKPFES
ncbi:recombinase family protein [Carboxylicivirga sp. RSCT41]|uniref:recombinase family protein n=1 Tax=Carboxylicivirga agarovorans TaxID=3417570 RepID=UPI003D344902